MTVPSEITAPLVPSDTSLSRALRRVALRIMPVMLMGLVGLSLAACTAGDALDLKAEQPVPRKLVRAMKAKDMAVDAPILLRVFKEESELEVWKKTDKGRYALLETYDICKWSGALGPKTKEGDRQAPEGFYTVNRGLLNPNSSYYLSFNLGYPNRFDRSFGRTGSHLMVHGACSSAGCYAMEDAPMGEIYALARDALKGGQQSFQVQALPFRMTAKNMARHHESEHFAFWQNLKVGYDHFELTRTPPKVDVCERSYQFNREAKAGVRFLPSARCPESTTPQKLAQVYASYQKDYRLRFEGAVRAMGGTPPPPLTGTNWTPPKRAPEITPPSVRDARDGAIADVAVPDAAVSDGANVEPLPEPTNGGLRGTR